MDFYSCQYRTMYFIWYKKIRVEDVVQMPFLQALDPSFYPNHSHNFCESSNTMVALADLF